MGKRRNAPWGRKKLVSRQRWKDLDQLVGAMADSLIGRVDWETLDNSNVNVKVIGWSSHGACCRGWALANSQVGCPVEQSSGNPWESTPLRGDRLTSQDWPNFHLTRALHIIMGLLLLNITLWRQVRSLCTRPSHI